MSSNLLSSLMLEPVITVVAVLATHKIPKTDINSRQIPTLNPLNLPCRFLK